MTEKKGFVLYFDAASSLAALCAEQRGELLLALFDYAERTAKQSLTPETALRSQGAAQRYARARGEAEAPAPSAAGRNDWMKDYTL